MPYIVNILGAITVALCALLLLRAYVKVKTRLLLWSGLCFAGLTVSNVLVFIDLALIGPHTSLYSLRLAVAAVSTLLLVYGLVFESE